MTINSTVALVRDITGTGSRIDYVPMRPGEDAHAAVQISEEGKARLEKLDFVPTPRGTAFRETIDWYKQHLGEFEWQG